MLVHGKFCNQCNVSEIEQRPVDLDGGNGFKGEARHLFVMGAMFTMAAELLNEPTAQTALNTLQH